MSELQHPDSRAFELVADLYERARPGYPQEAVDWIADELDLGAGRIVLDLGAGTGKLTRALVATGADVIAVEPGDAMRAELERVVPAARALAGVAEAIPLPDESVDAVTAGQSFHWFRVEEAVPQVRRVLRRGGGLALIWNERDQTDPLQRRVSSLLEPFVPPGRPSVAKAGWREVVEAGGLFEGIEERRFPFSQRLDANGLAERIGSTSFVAAAPAPQREALERELRELAASGEVDFAYSTAVFVTRAA